MKRNEVETTKPGNPMWRARPDARDVHENAEGVDRVLPELLPDEAKRALEDAGPGVGGMFKQEDTGQGVVDPTVTAGENI